MGTPSLQPTLPITESTDPTTELEQIIEPTEAVNVHLSESVKTEKSLSQKSTPGHDEQSSKYDNNLIVPSTDNLRISPLKTDTSLKSTFPPSLLLSSLHSSTTPSPPDYDQEDLKEIEIIGNTVSDNDGVL